MVYFREITEHYRIEKTLRSHGESGVFRAVDPITGTPVALKLISLAGAPPESAQAFVRGMGALQSLRHPSLPALHDFGFTPNGQAFLVLDYVDGRGAEALQGGAPAQILPLLGEVLDGLERLAGAGLAHHNLCPENLLVVPGPAPGRIKMVGLGTALLRPPGERPEGEAAGFAAPELGRPPEAGTAPWQADVFSLALVACRLLEARLDTENDPEASGAPAVSLPLGVSFELEDDQALRQVLSRCLCSRPSERPACEEVRRALKRALAGGTGEAPRRPLPESRIFLTAEPESAPWLPAPPPRDPGDDTNPVFPAEPAPAPLPPRVETLVAPFPLVPAEPPIPPELPEPRVALPVAPPPAPSPPPRRRSGRLLGAGAAAAVVLLGAGGFFWLRSREATPAAVPAPRHAARIAAPKAAPPAPVLPARSAGSAIPVAMVAPVPGPPPPPSGLPDVGRSGLATGLRTALKAGNLPQLATALRTLTAEERTALQAEPGPRRDLAAARQAVDLYQRYERARKGSDPAELLLAAGAVTAAVPRYREAADRREKTAATLEGEAETLAQTGALDAALERLEALHRGWPERPGLTERLARYGGEQRADQEAAAVLSSVSAAEARKRPEEGLAQLQGAKPTPRYESRFHEAQKRLESQLAQLDRNPPVVQLAGSAAALEFEKGATVRVPFQITDDFQVKTVSVHVRPEGGAWTELPCALSGAGCAIEVPPALHQNRTIELYVVATDLSGHKGLFGSAEKPQSIRRKHWYDRLRGKQA